MDERLGQVLRQRVEAYLREVERVLRAADPGPAWPAVRVRLQPPPRAAPRCAGR